MTEEKEQVESEAKEEEKIEESPREEEVKEEEDFKSKFFYLAAEMENMKRRHERERENLIKFGNERIISSLVSILDDLDRSLEHAQKEDENFKDLILGLEMVRTNFLEVLLKNGVKSVESIGKEFDPNFHEAMAQQPAEGKKDGEIITEFQKGYILNGRLIRPAKVVVVKN
ncbi:MAG: nucleotide exchange factor GrpE [Epsilonproteobacteria bacterium]|nr:MAG: nucleotide exchange factor GrpE [Campylobacterota bacterium]RLA66093.1 MAG: nucleotide exchange factor GrpE [Campylobacterota bacterium]